MALQDGLDQGPDEIARVLQRLGKGMVVRKLESPTLDFKMPSTSPKATFGNVAEAAVCFANSVGGTIVLGVSDDVAGPGTLVGTEIAPEILRRAVYERTSPGLDVTVDSLVVDGIALLVVTVPEGLEVYGTSTGRYCWRRGTDCLPMTADDVARLREERRGDDWSARSAPPWGPGRSGCDSARPGSRVAQRGTGARHRGAVSGQRHRPAAGTRAAHSGGSTDPRGLVDVRPSPCG
ncbi:MAG: AlbA family DNA-binding domain-containing protein [Pseudonocardiaceae bacterium]